MWKKCKNESHRTILIICYLLYSCGNEADPLPSPKPTLEQSITSGQGENAMKKNRFYEDNLLYTDTNDNPIPWQYTTPQEAGLNENDLLAGAKELARSRSAHSFIVIKSNKIVFEKYFNHGQADRGANIHSASKGIIASLAGLAIDKGFIKNTSQRLSQVLPGYVYKYEETKNITIEQLLTMTAGFKWEEDSTEYRIENEADWIQAILNLPRRSFPGEKFNYCTADSHLMSAIITETSGMSTFEFAEKYLFSQLGINVEHWGRDPQGYYSGGYNFYVTPLELARFALLYLNNGQFNGKQVIPEKWVENSLKKRPTDDEDWQYGYYWWITSLRGYDIYQLWGYGGQFAFLIPDLDMVVVITNDTSRDYREMDGDVFLGRYILP